MQNEKRRRNAALIVVGLCGLLACTKSPGEGGVRFPADSDSWNGTSSEPSNDGSANSSEPQAGMASFNHWPLRADDQFELAKRYADGNGVEQDPHIAGSWAKLAAIQGGHDGALEWLRKRANEDDPAAKLWLGIAYKYDSRHPEKRDDGLALLQAAERELRALAEQGDPKAQDSLGLMYDFGHAVDKDPSKANEWYEKAAKQGYAPAQFNLGVSYHTGSGVPLDEGMAEQWYRRAAEQGYVGAITYLAQLLYHRNKQGGDLREAVELFRQSAFRGDAAAQYSLALMSINGEGSPPNQNEAFSWYERAVAQGHHAAENNLGLMYEYGDGVGQDFAKAAELFEKAALGGDAKGQFNHARFYRDGVGVERNLKQAHSFFSLAAAQGDENARKEVEHVERLAKCETTAKTQLFGVTIACATRGQLRNAIKTTGGAVKREDDRYWYDLYNAQDLLDGSKELSVGYTRAGDFGHAEYVFPSHVNAGQVEEVAALVASKYGRPQSSLGDPRLGEVAYTWKLDDGVILTVRRGWPDTTTFLEYASPQSKTIVDQEIAAEKYSGQTKATERQSNAF